MNPITAPVYDVDVSSPKKSITANKNITPTKHLHLSTEYVLNMTESVKSSTIETI